MINLIPPANRTQIFWEYWLRVCTVWLGLASVVLVAVSALLLPTYVLLTMHLSALSAESEQVRREGTAVALVEEKIGVANTQVSLLASGLEGLPFSRFITAVDDSAGEDILVQSYIINRADSEVGQIQIQGEARNREALSAFGTRLENHMLFESAEIPIADLVQGIDVPFSITITVAEM